MKRFGTLMVLVSLWTFAAAQTPEDVAGLWSGSIEIPDSPLEVAVTLEAVDGELSGTVDIPAQGAEGLPLKDVTLEGDTLSFVIDGVDGDPTFGGTLAGDNLTGTYSQGPNEAPFTLTRGEAGANITAAEPSAEETAETYKDPEGRFNVPVPTNWTVKENEGYTTLLSPEGDIRVHLLTSPETDLESAVKQGWAEVAPDFTLESSDPQEPPSAPGVEKTLVIHYEGENQIAQAFAQLYGGTAYLLLIEGDLAAVQRRSAQVNIIASGFEISGLGDTDLTGTEPLTVDETITGELEAYVTDALKRFGIPGAAVAIVQNGEIVYEGGFGVKSMGGGEPITADTNMMIGSTGKSLTTMMMGTLVDDGSISWDTPVQEVLPEFKVSDPELSRTMTMRNLVCACTGVPRRDLELVFNADTLGAEEIVESLGTFTFFTGFGEAFQYSNQIVGTAGYAAAAADGASWGELYTGYLRSLQKRVLDPIGMTNTTLSLPKVKARGDYALPHSLNIRGRNEPFAVDLEQLLLPIAPAGAHWSTAHDMARYLVTELNVGVAPDGTRVVSEKNLRTTWEPQVEVSADTSYGLGWFVGDYKGLKLIEHGGNTFGFTSDFAFLPDAGLGIVVLANAQGTNAFNSAVRTRLFELVFEQDPEADKQATFSFGEVAKELEKISNNLQPIDRSVVTPYFGSYQNDALGEVSLRLDGDAVTFDTGEFAVPLVAETEDGKVKYLFNGPPLPGGELKLTGKPDAPTLTIGEGAVKYVFEKLE